MAQNIHLLKTIVITIIDGIKDINQKKFKSHVDKLNVYMTQGGGYIEKIKTWQ